MDGRMVANNGDSPNAAAPLLGLGPEYFTEDMDAMGPGNDGNAPSPTTTGKVGEGMDDKYK